MMNSCFTYFEKLFSHKKSIDFSSINQSHCPSIVKFPKVVLIGFRGGNYVTMGVIVCQILWVFFQIQDSVSLVCNFFPQNYFFSMFNDIASEETLEKRKTSRVINIFKYF